MTTKTKENLFLEPIEKAITNHTSDNFIINKNYEIVIPESGKSLLHPNYYDITTLKNLFDKLYADLKDFINDDIEVDAKILIHRLNALATFLKKIGSDARAVSRIITNINHADGLIKIEALTLRVFDNGQQIIAKVLLRPEVKDLLQNFCQQREISKQAILTNLKAFKQ